MKYQYLLLFIVGTISMNADCASEGYHLPFDNNGIAYHQDGNLVSTFSFQRRSILQTKGF